MELVCIDFAVEQWRRQRGRAGCCCEYRSTAPGQSFSPIFRIFIAPARAASRQTVFILRRFALFDAADKSNSCIPLPFSLFPCLFLPLWGRCSRYPFVALLLQVFQLIFAVLQGQLVGSCLRFFFLFYFRAMLHLLPVLLAAFVAVVAAASTLLCAQRSIEKV